MKINDFGNKNAPIGDDDIASSVTLSGQAVIKQSNVIIRNFVKMKTGLSDEEIMKKDPIIYNDTDSVTYQTVTDTNIGKLCIGDLYNLYDKQCNKQYSVWGHEIIPTTNLHVWSYDKTCNTNKFRKVKNLIRHKVSKEKYKITVGDKEVTMTGDHGCLVKRDGKLVRVKASEIKIGETMIISL